MRFRSRSSIVFDAISDVCLPSPSRLSSSRRVIDIERDFWAILQNLAYRDIGAESCWDVEDNAELSEVEEEEEEVAAVDDDEYTEDEKRPAVAAPAADVNLRDSAPSLLLVRS